MADHATMRAGDADRDRTVSALGEGMAAGWLTAEEFHQRLDLAYAAKTLGELDRLVADLPATDLGQLPSAALDRLAAGPLLAGRRPSGPAEAGTGRLSPAWRAAWGSWLAISLFLFAVWLLSGTAGGLWFLWVVLPLGVLMLGRWMTGAPAPGKRRSAARHDPEPRDDQSPRR